MSYSVEKEYEKKHKNKEKHKQYLDKILKCLQDFSNNNGLTTL
jgi:hypothetical protein